MKIAVIGTGIAGLTAAYYLREQHEIHLFERNDYAGGHSNTVSVKEGDRTLDLDTGFLVHNHKNYPNLIRLFEKLGVQTQETEMSFACRCHRCDIEYRGSDLSTIFAQKKNLLRPSMYWMVREILRFHREARDVLKDARWADRPLRDFIRERAFSTSFQNHFLWPFCAAIWSAPRGEAELLPATFVIQFFENHALLGRDGAPIWRTMVGGSRNYVQAITREFAGRVHLGRPIRGVRRTERGVRIVDAAGREEVFDQAIIGTHGDEALALLEDASEDERSILGNFTYTVNDVVLHTDEDALPRREKVRAAWNYEIEDCRSAEKVVSCTYSISRLMRVPSKTEYSVTLNRARPLDSSKVLRRFVYTHPRFTVEAFDAQRKLPQINGRRKVWFCGSYFGYGFHEDGHVAGLEVARKLGGSC